MSYSKNKIGLIVLALMVSMVCHAQYHPVFSQYMFNALAINPAAAGSQEVLSLAAMYRTQWLKYDGAPNTQTLSGDFPLRNPQIALGLLVYNDRIGIYRQTGLFGTYAFRIKMGEGKLSLGLQAGFEQRREDQSKITTLDPDDVMFNGEINKTFMPNVGFGVYYYTANYFAGLSIPYLLSYSPHSADSYKAKLSVGDIKLYGGIIVPINKAFKVRPSSLLQYEQGSFLADINCNAILLPDETFEVGLSYRSTKTMVILAEVRIKPQLSLGYSYDHTFGMVTSASGSHEIMLRYIFQYRVKAENPLYLY